MTSQKPPTGWGGGFVNPEFQKVMKPVDWEIELQARGMVNETWYFDVFIRPWPNPKYHNFSGLED